MAAKLTRLTHKMAIQMHTGKELCHLQFSLQAAGPETFGYNLVYFIECYKDALNFLPYVK
jgi:hypothetical protein